MPDQIETCATVFPVFKLGREERILSDAMVYATIDRPDQVECRFRWFGSNETWTCRVNRP